MIISIPTDQGNISFVLNGTLLKAIGLVIVLLATFAGFAVMQLANFIVSVTPVQFFHILGFVGLVGVVGLVRRIVFMKGRGK